MPQGGYKYLSKSASRKSKSIETQEAFRQSVIDTIEQTLKVPRVHAAICADRLIAQRGI